MNKHNNNPETHHKDTKNNSKPNIPIKIILEETENNLQAFKADNEQIGIFKIKSGNDWIKEAKTRPIPKMLFGKFWFENELCILFADTNLGKSILAVQIGNSISKQEQIDGFDLEATKQPILYFDFELSDKQFENRYSINFKEHYNWDSNFLRVEINPDVDIPDEESFESYLYNSLENTIIKKGAKILIIDNITYLKNETEKSKNALPLMKLLKALKSKYNLSILVLAHTPKRDSSKPLTRNDLAGSKMLINFADSSFAIGESHKDKSLRYLKQIKARNTEIVYDTENIVLCNIDKPNNFLKFNFINYTSEREHLKQTSKEDQDKLEQNIIDLKRSNPDLSLNDIAEKLNTYKMKVKRILDKQNNS